jgi:hypothetical protein
MDLGEDVVRAGPFGWPGRQVQRVGHLPIGRLVTGPGQDGRQVGEQGRPVRLQWRLVECLGE